MDIIEDFYNRNPYPKAEKKFVVPAKDFWQDVLYKTGIEHSGKTPSIWIPGCGTILPVYIRLQYPHATILATDISTKQLDYLQEYVEKFNIGSNLKIVREDMLESAYNGTFDYIIATGVLHHLKDVRKGFEILYKSLTKEGLSEVMVYSKIHRDYYMKIKNMLNILCPAHNNYTKDDFHKIFYALSHATPRSPYTAYYYKEALELIEHDYETFIDVYLNPREKSFSLNELFDMLRQTNFSFINWVKDRQWDLTERFCEFEGTLKNLQDQERYQFLLDFDYDFSPYFLFYMTKQDNREIKPVYCPEFLRNKIVKRVDGFYYLEYFNNKAIKTDMDFSYHYYDLKIRKHLELFSSPVKGSDIIESPQLFKSFNELFALGDNNPLHII